PARARPARWRVGTMSLPRNARDSLRYLKSQFNAKAAICPNLKHILIEIPFRPPEPPVPPWEGSPAEKLRYEALYRGAQVARYAPGLESTEPLVADFARRELESAKRDLFAYARDLGVPDDEAATIIRSGIETTIEESKAPIRDPFWKAWNEAQLAVAF